MKNYYLKSFASLLVLTFSFLSLSAQDYDCDCEGGEYDPVCVAGPFGLNFQVDNLCIAECLELEVIDGDCDEWEDPWGDCDCEEPEDESEGLCVLIFDDIFLDSILVWAPCECFIECWYGEDEYVITDCNFDDWPDGDDGDFPPNDWEDCDCEFDGENEGLCFLYFDAELQDTLEAWAPNECFIECWYDSIDYVVVDCDWGNPWGSDCDCEEPTDDLGVCFNYVDSLFQDTLLGWAPNECFIECWYGDIEYEITECDIWDPWGDDCECEYEEGDEGFCFLYFDEYYQDTLEAWVPNECFIQCWYDSIDYVVVDCDFGNPWGDDCDCEEPVDDVGVCFIYVDEIFGEEVYGWAPSECFIACWYDIDEYELTECDDWDPWGDDCDCPEPENDEGVCFVYFDEIYQDSLTGWAPNECFITCWYDSISYTITECEDFDDHGGELDSCLLFIDLESFETLQSLLLALSEECDLELPECIADAPIFDTDEEFIEYIEENCDDLGNLNGDMMEELLGLFDEPLTPDEENALTPAGFEIKAKSNPTQEEVIYTVESEIEGPATITAVDLNGNVFEYQQVNLHKGPNDFTMNINTISSQIFVIHVQTATDFKTLKVFVE